MSDEVAIKVENLTKTYRLYAHHIDRLKESLSLSRRKYHHNFNALNDVSFEIKKGETVGIVGKNGSGKSTLLKIISGVLMPTSGTVTVNGKISALLELGAGFNPELTGVENVYFNGILMGYSKEEMDSKLEEILSFADIGAFAYQQVKTYSSGMFVRLAFAVAVIVEPDILIIDEALSVGDELFQRKCFAKIEHFTKKDITLIFVSHSIAKINEICKRAMFIDSGELLMIGPSKHITTQYDRFLFSQVDQLENIRNELRKLPIDSASCSDSQLSDVYSDEYSSQQAEVETGDDVFLQKAYFMPDLVSKSALEYQIHDVAITDIKLVTLQDELVNVLVMNEEYIYSYSLEFSYDYEQVGTGIAFKTATGVIISSSFRKGHYIDKVKAGTKYLVKWRFICNLLPGIYYTNVAVASELNYERKILNKITDATVFKVNNVPNLPFAGIVHLNQTSEIIEIQSA